MKGADVIPDTKWRAARLRSRHPETRYSGELPASTVSRDQPSALTGSIGPLARTTPIGQDTPVPWSGQ